MLIEELKHISKIKKTIADILINDYSVNGQDKYDEDGKLIEPGLYTKEGNIKFLAQWPEVLQNRK